MTFHSNFNSTWIGSTIRDEQCKNYYNYFPAKSFICTVSLGTYSGHAAGSEGQNAESAYTNENVFLLSSVEYGFSESETYGNFNEFDQHNLSKIPYQYFTSNNTRIKRIMEGGGPVSYWTRSKTISTSGYLCYVTGQGKLNTISSEHKGTKMAPAFAI